MSYISLVDDTCGRHYQQETFWNFNCDCMLCKDDLYDKQKHSLMCNICKKIRPIDVKSWKMIELSSDDQDLYSWCCCMIKADDHATEQDVRMYKYIWNKVSTLKSDKKVIIAQLYSVQRPYNFKFMV